eukprot:Clim_evm127s210 gene=Clim_evmTU127s210
MRSRVPTVLDQQQLDRASKSTITSPSTAYNLSLQETHDLNVPDDDDDEEKKSGVVTIRVGGTAIEDAPQNARWRVEVMIGRAGEQRWACAEARNDTDGNIQSNKVLQSHRKGFSVHSAIPVSRGEMPWLVVDDRTKIKSYEDGGEGDHHSLTSRSMNTLFSTSADAVSGGVSCEAMIGNDGQWPRSPVSFVRAQEKRMSSKVDRPSPSVRSGGRVSPTCRGARRDSLARTADTGNKNIGQTVSFDFVDTAEPEYTIGEAASAVTMTASVQRRVSTSSQTDEENLDIHTERRRRRALMNLLFIATARRNPEVSESQSPAESPAGIKRRRSNHKDPGDPRGGSDQNLRVTNVDRESETPSSQSVKIQIIGPLPDTNTDCKVYECEVGVDQLITAGIRKSIDPLSDSDLERSVPEPMLNLTNGNGIEGNQWIRASEVPNQVSSSANSTPQPVRRGSIKNKWHRTQRKLLVISALKKIGGMRRATGTQGSVVPSANAVSSAPRPNDMQSVDPTGRHSTKGLSKTLTDQPEEKKTMEIQVAYSLLEDWAMPLSFYRSLLDFLQKEEHLHLLPVIHETLSSSQGIEFCEYMTAIYESMRAGGRLVGRLVEIDSAQARNAEDIFRVNGLTPRMISIYLRLQSKKRLCRVLWRPLTQILLTYSNVALPLNTLSLTDAMSTSGSFQSDSIIANRLYNPITQILETMKAPNFGEEPSNNDKCKMGMNRSVRQLLARIYNMAAARFDEEEAYRCLAGFYFLRHVCVAIVSPDLFGMSLPGMSHDDQVAEITPLMRKDKLMKEREIRHVLLLVSKVIQCVTMNTTPCFGDTPDGPGLTRLAIHLREEYSDDIRAWLLAKINLSGSLDPRRTPLGPESRRSSENSVISDQSSISSVGLSSSPVNFPVGHRGPAPNSTFDGRPSRPIHRTIRSLVEGDHKPVCVSDEVITEVSMSQENIGDEKPELCIDKPVGHLYLRRGSVAGSSPFQDCERSPRTIMKDEALQESIATMGVDNLLQTLPQKQNPSDNTVHSPAYHANESVVCPRTSPKPERRGSAIMRRVSAGKTVLFRQHSDGSNPSVSKKMKFPGLDAIGRRRSAEGLDEKLSLVQIHGDENTSEETRDKNKDLRSALSFVLRQILENMGLAIHVVEGQHHPINSEARANLQKALTAISNTYVPSQVGKFNETS